MGLLGVFEDIECISVTGGGLKAVSYLGIFTAFGDHFEKLYGISWSNYLKQNVQCYTGASAGAIIALALNLDVDTKTCTEIIRPIFENVQNLIPKPDIGELWINYGLEKGDVLRKIISDLLKHGGLDQDITFESMYNLTRRQFACTGTNLTTSESKIFTHTTSPKMRVLDAVFISACVPIIFAPVWHDGDLYIDGALTCSLPILRPIEQTLVCCLRHPPRQGVDDWQSYLSALFKIGLISQADHLSDAIKNAKKSIQVKLPEDLGLLQEMDLNMDSSSFQGMFMCGYTSALTSIVPDLLKTICTLIKAIFRSR